MGELLVRGSVRRSTFTCAVEILTKSFNQILQALQRAPGN